MLHAPCSVLRTPPCSVLLRAPCSRTPCSVLRAPCSVLRAHAPCSVLHAPCSVLHAPCSVLLLRAPCSVLSCSVLRTPAPCSMLRAPSAPYYAPCSVPCSVLKPVAPMLNGILAYTSSIPVPSQTIKRQLPMSVPHILSRSCSYTQWFRLSVKSVRLLRKDPTIYEDI